MAKYKKRSDGRFYTQVSTGKSDENGSLIRIPVYGTSSRDLENKVSEIRADLNRGTYADDKGMLFGVYADMWLETYKKNVVECSTYQTYERIIKNNIGLIKNIRLRDISKSNVQSQINESVKSYETQRMIKITVNQILECAIDDGLLYKNVARKIVVKAPIKTNEKRILTDLEKKAIRICKEDNIFTQQEKFFIDTLFCTGVRPGEMLALTRSSICKNKNTLSVNQSLTWKGGKALKAPKSRSGIREIEVPSWYMKEACEYIKTLDSIYLFPGINGELISKTTYGTLWHSIFQKINLQLGGTKDTYYGGKYHKKGIHATDLTPYVFRHNYATMLYYQGFDLKEAQRLLGHSNIKITLEIYTHLASKENSIKDKVDAFAI